MFEPAINPFRSQADGLATANANVPESASVNLSPKRCRMQLDTFCGLSEGQPADVICRPRRICLSRHLRT